MHHLIFLKVAKLILRSKWFRQNRKILEKEYSFELIESKKEGVLEAGLRKAFSVFGEQGFKLKELSIQGGENLFVPNSKIKEIKRELSDLIENAYLLDVEMHKKTVKSKLRAGTVDVLSAKKDKEDLISVKIDRLEYIEALEAVQFDELIFEPKRAFANGVKAKDGIGELAQFCKQSKLKFTLAVPTVVRAWDEPYLKIWFDEFIASGFNSFELGNVGAVELLDKWYEDSSKFDLCSDFTMYSFNSQASKSIEEMS